jgi:hypothetical protein
MRVTIGMLSTGIWGAVDDDQNVILCADPDGSLNDFKMSVMQCIMNDNEYGITELVMSDQAEIAYLLERPTAKRDNDGFAGLTGHRCLLIAFNNWVIGAGTIPFRID